MIFDGPFWVMTVLFPAPQHGVKRISVNEYTALGHNIIQRKDLLLRTSLYLPLFLERMKSLHIREVLTVIITLLEMNSADVREIATWHSQLEK